MRLQVPESLTTSVMLVVVLAEVVGANPPNANTTPSSASDPLPGVVVHQPLPKANQPSADRSTPQASPQGSMLVPPDQASQKPSAQSSPLRQSLINTSHTLDGLLQEP